MIHQTKVGIMQGRLLPPVNGKIQSFPAKAWKEEFELAGLAGVSGIEFIFEADQWQANPLLASTGRETIRTLSARYHVAVDTICLDYFMEHGFGDGGDLDLLPGLMQAATDIGAQTMNLPLLGASAIDVPQARERAGARLLQIAPDLERRGLRMALETSLGPAPLREFIHAVGHAAVGINYDTGNSAYFGHTLRDEMAEYAQFIYSVHIKDCFKGQPSVRLGTGATDFESFFAALDRINYSGPIVLQSARTEADPVRDVANQAAFVKERLARYAGQALAGS
jgi:L-ribulose-5-phosphate 3-epimerase